MGSMTEKLPPLVSRFMIRPLADPDSARLVGFKRPAGAVGRVGVRRDYGSYLYTDLKFRSRYERDNPFHKNDFLAFTFPSEQDAEEAFALHLLLQAGSS